MFTDADIEQKPVEDIRSIDRTSTIITIILCIAVTLFAFVTALIIMQNLSHESTADGNDADDPQYTGTNASVGAGSAEISAAGVPRWVVQDFIDVNKYSRPGKSLTEVNGVVVHYVGNPGTTAKQNRDYFNNLATTHERYASSHFIVDTDGTVIQCIPLDEIAYCSNSRNSDTISIECCHLDESGKFTETELESLTNLLKWLIDTYDLDREDIIRHYDVTGKICPKYYVDNPEEWESFRDSLFEPVENGIEADNKASQNGDTDDIFTKR